MLHFCNYSHGQKYRHPCNSVRKCNPSQKIVAVANVLVLTFIFLFAFEQHKKTEKKSKIWYNSTQSPTNSLDKIIGTLNLTFGSTPFGENNWNQSLPVTMNEFLTPLYWNFGPLTFHCWLYTLCIIVYVTNKSWAWTWTLFFCKLLQVIQIWRMPSPNCCFEISPQVFYGIQIWTHCWPFQNSPALCL